MKDLIFIAQRQLKYTNLLLQRIESAETVLQQSIARIQARQLSKDFANSLIDEQRKHEEKLFKDQKEKDQKEQYQVVRYLTGERRMAKRVDYSEEGKDDE